MSFRLFGRSSSHFTRITRLVADELGVPLQFQPIFDITTTEPQNYGGHPALKLPTLQTDDGPVFGTENICRVLAEAAPQRPVLFAERLRSHRAKNALELSWHAASAQVQLVFGTTVGKLPADNVYFTKGRAGFEGALRWLDEHLDGVRAEQPRDALSLTEVVLFCVLEHCEFRQTLPLEPYAKLRAFRADFGQRPAAERTAYAFDQP